MGKITILEPRWVAKVDSAQLSPRPSDLRSARIVTLWNAKPGGDALLRGVEQGLDRAGLGPVAERFKKEVAVHEAGEALLSQVAQSADVVINAIAD